MKTALALSLTLLSCVPSLALAHGDFKCSVPREEWKERDDLAKQLQKDGWTIRKIKIDNGCYEVYGFDKQGRKREAYFNPKTLEPVGDVKP